MRAADYRDMAKRLSGQKTGKNTLRKTMDEVWSQGPRATLEHLACALGSLSIVSARTTTNYRAWNNFYGIYPLSRTRSLLLLDIFCLFYIFSFFFFVFLRHRHLLSTAPQVHKLFCYGHRSQGAFWPLSDSLGHISFGLVSSWVSACSFLWASAVATDRHLGWPLSPAVANY